MGSGHNQHNSIECYYYVKGYCYSREVGAMYCSTIEKPCERVRIDLNGVQWKEKYWSLMKALREKVAK